MMVMALAYDKRQSNPRAILDVVCWHGTINGFTERGMERFKADVAVDHGVSVHDVETIYVEEVMLVENRGVVTLTGALARRTD